MVVRAEKGRKHPVISKIIPDGAAAEHATIRVGDELLEVNGVSCAGKSAEVLVWFVLHALCAVSASLITRGLTQHLRPQDLTPLFLGPVGSPVVLMGRGTNLMLS